MAITDVEAALSEVLAVTEERYVANNPRSERRFRQAGTVMPGGNTRTSLYYSPFPVTFVAGEGQFLTDLDGHRYVDLLGEYSAGLYGHSDPAVLTAVRKVLEEGLSYGGPNQYEVELAKEITHRFPSVELLRFTNSGTEANLFAIGTARAVTGRSKVLVFESGYHGGVLSFRGEAPLNAPYSYVVCEYNDVPGTMAAIREHRDDLAAVILEPMLGGGGAVPATAEFVSAIRAATTRYEVVFILDEVMTSRLAPGGLQERFGIVPDLTTFGKYLGAGFSFGAFGGNRSLMERFDPSVPGSLSHPGTFNNNTVTMAAGLAGLRDVFTAEAVRDLNARGDGLRDRLNSLFFDFDVSIQATGVGSILGLHFQRSPIVSGRHIDPAPDRRKLLHLELMLRGFYLARRGYLALPLPVTDADLASFVDAVGEVVATHRRVFRQGR
ncbi:glutamate-1-semialdehyde 2,1-aminomutase [Streptomyces sp. SAI-117]|uniref:aspartate aminotransferase family protein n=1 Tax=Streptomyces sp. SAI-117 TaxID=2940546 RepID=UPI0024739D02|nr:aminotransferase class III-fold pyridoxal phosphate-dependent enzyme [Streptomyces sp. SAI-117]MDH6573684.1 glutamate-1-semialdehyde 2,1-aminomutase [Streptomyces sp. SAI-117]